MDSSSEPEIIDSTIQGVVFSEDLVGSCARVEGHPSWNGTTIRLNQLIAQDTAYFTLSSRKNLVKRLVDIVGLVRDGV